MPDNDMVVGHLHTGMAFVEVHGHMIISTREPCEVELLPVSDILDWNHVDGAHPPPLPVVGEKGSCWQSFGSDVKHTQSRQEARDLHEIADPPKTTGWGSQ